MLVGYWLGSDWDESVKYLLCVVSDLIPDCPGEGAFDEAVKMKVGVAVSVGMRIASVLLKSGITTP